MPYIGASMKTNGSPHSERSQRKAAKRRAKMAALRAKGWTLAKIGRRHRITRQRVLAILAANK